MFIDADDGSNPVLLLHGAGVSGWMWSPTRELLGPTVKAIVPDLPGFGRSSGHPYVSHKATVQELAGVFELHAPLGAHVVGFSLGAQLALLLAAEFPHLVRGVVVISAETKPAPLPGPTLALLGLAEPLSKRKWFATAQARQLGIPADHTEDFLRDSTATTRETLLSSVGENIRFTLPEAWSQYPGAATVLVGERERKLMHDSAKLTTTALPGSKLRMVSGAAHDLPLSQPGTVAAEVSSQITEFNASAP